LNDQTPPGFIAIEGPIGVGKTTLARKLAGDLNGDLILENAQDNPFLEKFYNDPQAIALPTQLFFLFQRMKQLKKINQTDMFSSCKVADFLMEKDSLFAKVTLDKDELELYQQVYENLTIDAAKPDLVVYLQAPTEILIKRIQSRSQVNGQPIKSEYITKIAEAYTRFFHYYDKSPLLIVNASGLDIVNNETDYQQLKQQILNTRTGRHYFNPIPFQAAN